MTSKTISVACAWILFLATHSPAASTTTTVQTVPPDKAAIVFWLPVAEAAIKVQGVAINQEGLERLHFTPALKDGHRYEYRIEATWIEAGSTKSELRRLEIQAGQAYVVDCRPQPKLVADVAAVDLTPQTDVGQRDVGRPDAGRPDVGRTQVTPRGEGRTRHVFGRHRRQASGGAPAAFTGTP
jgi:uncharacterized protein (TIGR03000 family)